MRSRITCGVLLALAKVNPAVAHHYDRHIEDSSAWCKVFRQDAGHDCCAAWHAAHLSETARNLLLRTPYSIPSISQRTCDGCRAYTKPNLRSDCYSERIRTVSSETCESCRT